MYVILQFSAGLEKNKLFLKGLPFTATKSELEELFAVVGVLLHHSFLHNNATVYYLLTNTILHDTAHLNIRCW